MERTGLDAHKTNLTFEGGKLSLKMLEELWLCTGDDQGGSVRDVSAILRHVKPESSFHYMQLSAKHYLDVAGKYLAAA